MSLPELAGLSRRLKPPRLRTVAATCSVVALFGTGAGVVSAIYLLNRPTGSPRRDVHIEKGMSVATIGRELQNEGLIRSPSFLRALSLVAGTSRKLTAGDHPFHGGMTTWEILKELEVPRDVTRDVTIPEGFRLEQAVTVISDSLGLSSEKLLELTKSPAFCKSLGVKAATLEGYLFPETYRFSLSMTEQQVLELMVGHFFKVFDSEMLSQARKRGMSLHEVVILGSIIEGEARIDEERPVISAVYHNRLRRKMRLQADPTVQYALKEGPRRLFYRDYAIDSPYNTYRIRGLPPGPIMSPGEASLRAALQPADVDYVYFVAQGDGSHLFSRTGAEHQRAKRKTYRARRDDWNQQARN
jgi:UPF0755 protein